jgi:hypothetical protein
MIKFFNKTLKVNKGVVILVKGSSIVSVIMISTATDINPAAFNADFGILLLEDN